MYNDFVLRDRDQMTWISAFRTRLACFNSLHPENGAIGGKENVK